jgi:hypothetical protein
MVTPFIFMKHAALRGVAAGRIRVKQLNRYKVPAGTKTPAPKDSYGRNRVQKVPSTTNTTIHKHHHHGGAVCPSFDVGSMDLPNLMVVTSLEGVRQERFAWV